MLFMQAARLKLRFSSAKGELTVEQLFDLPLQAKNMVDLDNVAKEVNRQLKAMTEESFVDNRNNPAKAELELKLAIVVAIIEMKKDESEKARSAAQRKQERDRLTEILHVRTQQDLLSKSPQEIQAMIDSLA